MTERLIDFTCVCCRETFPDTPEYVRTIHGGRCMNCSIYCDGPLCRFDPINRLCHWCGGKLVPIGHSRMNGRNHNDWDRRRLHKKCWLEWRQEDC